MPGPAKRSGTLPAVTADGQTVVRGEDDDGVLELAEVLERPEQPAEVTVQTGDHAVVLVQVPADRLPGARPRFKAFVPDGELAVVEGMVGQVVLRKRNVLAAVHVQVFLRRDTQVVRLRDAQVHEERLVPGA